MRPRTAQHALELSRDSIPDGAPSWITSELIANTLDTWQPYYAERLTVDDAVAILQAVGRLADVLGTTS